jgi:DNA-binding transcriptional regulator YdaS (Cro superfamily)
MTKQQRKELAKVLERAIETAGGVTALADFITDKYEPITKQAISLWEVCPPRRAAQVAAAVKAAGGHIPAQELRPDLYEPLAA